MDYGSLMRQAWDVTRRSPVLRRLGVISAAQAIVYSLVLGMMLVPLTVLPQVTASITQAAVGQGSAADPLGGAGATAIADAAQSFMDYLPALAGAATLLFCVWIALGILDVAAQGGLVAEVDGALRGRPRSLRDRMRGGFTMWWRIAGLYTVAALPSLLLVLAMGLATMLTFTLPLMRGDVPNPALTMSSQLVLMPLQGVVSLASIVLAVVVQVGLRSAVLENLPWRESLRRGLALIKANLVQVVLTYLLATVIASVATMAVATVGAVVVGVLTALVFALYAASASALGPLAIVIAVTGGLALTAVGVVLYGVFIAWMSSVWTILWLRLTSPNAPDAVQRDVQFDAVAGTQ